MMRALLLPVLALAAAACAAEPAPTPKEIKQAVNVGKGNMRASLKDPESAQFRNLFLASHTLTTDSGKNIGVLMLCGEVNAKNGYGGYGGFRPFAASGSSPGLPGHIADDADDEVFVDVIWNRVCSNKLRDVN